MRVSQMMSVQLVTCPADASVGDACRRMRDGRVCSVLVCEAGRPGGSVTERDVVQHEADREAPESVPVRAHIATELITVPPDAPAADVAELMNAHRIRHLPIVEGGTPVGIVSLRDFFVMSGANL